MIDDLAHAKKARSTTLVSQFRLVANSSADCLNKVSIGIRASKVDPGPGGETCVKQFSDVEAALVSRTLVEGE